MCGWRLRGGESASLEFKSTFRWDLREKRFNRSLESVVMKTLAGYMNGQGGTLLIGVADDGSIVGLELDYSTLKKPDRDGFEQVLMTAVASKLGGDACRNVQAVFHSVEEQRCLPRDRHSGTSPGVCARGRHAEALRAHRREHTRVERAGRDQLHRGAVEAVSGCVGRALPG